MIEKLLEWLKNQSVSFLFFLGGAVIGFLLCITAYYVFAKKKRKVVRGVVPKDLSAVADGAKYRLTESGTGFNFKDKTELFCDELKNGIDSAINAYYGDDAKLFAVRGSEKIFYGGLAVPLDFTVYEIIGFVDCVLDDIEKIYNDFLDDPRFRALWKYRAFVARGLDKNPREVSVAVIIDTVSEKIQKSKEPPKRGLFAFIGKKVVKTAMDKVVEPKAAPMIDEALGEAVACAVKESGLLFSHNLRGGGAESMKYLVGYDDGENAV